MIYKWELALQYYPGSKSKKAATDRLKYAIDHCHELKRLISCFSSRQWSMAYFRRSVAAFLLFELG